MARDRFSPPAVLLWFLLLALAVGLPAKDKKDKNKDKDDWLPITPEELAVKDAPSNPGAHAILLFRGVHTDVLEDFEKHHYRIKILSEEGKKYADIEIPFDKEAVKVEDIRARTVRADGTAANFEGNPFEKVVVKAKGVKFFAKTFTLPEVQVGSIVEYKYTLRSDPGPLIRTPWTLQSELFTRRMRLFLRPEMAFFGLFRSAVPIWIAFGLPEGKAPKQVWGGGYELELENIAPFEEEDFMPPADTRKMRVEFYYHDLFRFAVDAELSKKENKGLKEEINRLPQQDAFWKGIGKVIYEDDEGFLAKRKAIERVVTGSIRPDDPPEAKLRKLFARTQQIRNMSFEREKTEKEEKREKLKDNENVEELLKHGYGNAYEINLLFVALARAAGFDAYQVHIKSRNRGAFVPQMLNLGQFNTTVVMVRLGTEERYLDPAMRHCPYDLLPWNETDVEGLRVTKEGGVRVKTPPPKSADAILARKGTLELSEDGSLHGKLQLVFTGQGALSRRLEARELDELGRRKELEEEVKGWLPAEATVKIESFTGWENSEEPLRAELSVEVPHFATAAGRRLLLPLAVFQSTRRHPFPHAKRIHPIYFRYPWEERDEVTMQLPAGYQIESLPHPQQRIMLFGRYEMSGKSEAGSLRLERRLVMNRYFFRVEEYPVLRDFYNSVKFSDEQQVVLQASEAARRD